MGPALLVILALVIMVVVHELGHFLMARAVGIRATKFYVFFPPALWKVQRGDVEYGVGAIPLGGFVKLPGMFEPQAHDVHWRLDPLVEQVAQSTPDVELRERMTAAFARIPDARSAVALAEALAVLRTLVGQAAQLTDDPVGPLAEPGRSTYVKRARRLATRIQATIDDCHPKAFWRARLWRRMAVILAGPVVNLVIGLAILLAVYTFAAPSIELQSLEAAKITRTSPAADAGMRKGDELVRWNGTKLTPTREGRLTRLINQTRGKPVTVVWKRDGELHSSTLTPRTVKGVRQIGITFGADKVRAIKVHQPVDKAWSDSWTRFSDLTLGTAKSLARIADPEVRKQYGTVVGIVKVADDVHHDGRLLEYMGLISLVLGVTNLLPLLPLDGGHLLFGLVEALRRGRPLPRAAFERYSVAGLAFMLLLMFIGLRNDLRI